MFAEDPGLMGFVVQIIMLLVGTLMSIVIYLVANYWHIILPVLAAGFVGTALYHRSAK